MSINLQPLYNEQQKLAYIETRTNDGKAQARRLFQRFSSYEFEHNCDIVDMPLEVLQPIFYKHAGLSVRSIKSTQRSLKRYNDWCLTNNLTTNRAIYELDTTPPDSKVKNEMVSSPTHLMKILDECFDPAGSETIDAVRRAILWLAFANFTLEEDMDVKVSDVDLSTLKVKWRHPTNEYSENRPLYIQAKPDFEVLTTNDYFYVDFRRDDGSLSKIPRAEGDWLLRGTRKSGVTQHDMSAIKTFWHTTNAKLKEHGYNLGVDKLRRSGIFYRMYEDERAGISPDFAGITITEVDRKYTRKGMALGDIDPEVLENNVYMTRMQFSKDYEVWKSAFAV